MNDLETRLTDAMHELASTTTVSTDARARIRSGVAAPAVALRPRRWPVVTAVVATAAVVVGAVLITSGALDQQPERAVVTDRPRLGNLPVGSDSQGQWGSVPTASAGLGTGSWFNAVASSSRGFVLVGERAANGDRVASVWRSSDGVHWRPTTTPRRAGVVNAVAMHGDDGVAVGGTGRGLSSFVWTTTDGGRTWQESAGGDDVFGAPASEMGRPFVAGVTFHAGRWVAYGAGSRGYTAVWVSRDGERWTQTLDDDAGGSGSVTVVAGTEPGTLFAYGGGATTWTSPDGVDWERVSSELPTGAYLLSVAPRATAALGDSFDVHGQPTPLLRSTDAGRTWTVDDSLLTAFPDAHGGAVTRAAGRWVVAGTSGVPNHPDAWISDDLRTWTALPERLHGAPGGVLSLVASSRGTVVLFGTAPELDRFYVLDLH